MPNRSTSRVLALGMAAAALAACADQPGPTQVELPTMRAEAEAALTDLVTVDLDGDDLTFWPYTGRTPTIGDVADPINLIFTGEGADPRLIRAALMSLPGDRSVLGLPNEPPFNCTWNDAIGGTQAVYAEGYGWSGSVVQLQCGTYEEIRVHVRLFRVGDVTLGAVHLDYRIPGTTDHEVLAWELAQAFVMGDFARLGVAPTLSGVLNQTPVYRQVIPPIFNALAAAPAPTPEWQLFQLLRFGDGGALPPSLRDDGFLFNDGMAAILDVPAGPAAPGGGAVVSDQTVVIDFDQTIPRPFCEGDGQELIHVEGPVTLTQKVIYTPSGNFTSQYHAKGHLNVTQVAPTPSETYRALVNQHGRGVLTDQVNMVNDIQLRMEIRGKGKERGQLRLNVRIGPNGVGEVSGSASCKP